MRIRADSPTKTCNHQGCTGALRARGLCSTHYNQQHQPNRHERHDMQCSVCGAPVQRCVRRGQRVCSVVCRTALLNSQAPTNSYDWAVDAAHRARKAGAQVIEVFDRITVFERDAWTCGVCSIPVDADVDALHPDSATVDHIVPLSRGGDHSLVNVQCAHLRCNSIKNDRVDCYTP